MSQQSQYHPDRFEEFGDDVRDLQDGFSSMVLQLSELNEKTDRATSNSSQNNQNRTPPEPTRKNSLMQKIRMKISKNEPKIEGRLEEKPETGLNELPELTQEEKGK
ncbi:16988_t:CDS:2 [Rhizophagus irregularis]|nr:16988_t:CDS:2 [Rhizophagus irregularis]